MNLKGARIDAGLKQTDIVGKLDGIDVPLYSKIEAGKCNLIPSHFRVFCDLVGKAPHEICKPEDIDYGVRIERKRRHRSDIYNLHCPIPMEIIGSHEQLHKAVEAAGYKHTTEFIIASIRSLQASVRQKKAASDVPASKAEGA